MVVGLRTSKTMATSSPSLDRTMDSKGVVVVTAVDTVGTKVVVVVEPTVVAVGMVNTKTAADPLNPDKAMDSKPSREAIMVGGGATMEEVVTTAGTKAGACHCLISMEEAHLPRPPEEEEEVCRCWTASVVVVVAVVEMVMGNHNTGSNSNSNSNRNSRDTGEQHQGTARSPATNMASKCSSNSKASVHRKVGILRSRLAAPTILTQRSGADIECTVRGCVI
mmetsp:Transcript_3924/g.5701  ORF Transcript_3924/g.5701 Transcript_3924/m.5701 type:complete len:222 (+) Transcript_3924:1388-2053(+)